MKAKKQKYEPRFPDCKTCEHFETKRACRFDRACLNGEHYEECLKDCVPSDDDLLDNMMRKSRHDD